jgi:outer membrane protein assembly factor BamB
VVYAAIPGSNLFAVHAVNGTKLWSFPNPNEVAGPTSTPTPSADGTVVYVVSGDFNLYAVHAANGT